MSVCIPIDSCPLKLISPVFSRALLPPLADIPTALNFVLIIFPVLVEVPEALSERIPIPLFPVSVISPLFTAVVVPLLYIPTLSWPTLIIPVEAAFSSFPPPSP